MYMQPNGLVNDSAYLQNQLIADALQSVGKFVIFVPTEINEII